MNETHGKGKAFVNLIIPLDSPLVFDSIVPHVLQLDFLCFSEANASVGISYRSAVSRQTMSDFFCVITWRLICGVPFQQTVISVTTTGIGFLVFQ